MQAIQKKKEVVELYVVFFGVGVGFILLSVLVDALVDFGGVAIFFLQPKLIAIFLTVTGGVGLILSARFDGILAAGIIFAISAVSGLFVAGIIYRFVIVPLHRAQNTSTFDKQDAIGTTAKVISPIPQGGYGKIRYSISGSVVTGPAKSKDGNEIGNGAEVSIVDIEDGTYFVRKHLDIMEILKSTD